MALSTLPPPRGLYARPTMWSTSSASSTRPKSPSFVYATNAPPRSVRTASGLPWRAIAARNVAVTVALDGASVSE